VKRVLTWLTLGATGLVVGTLAGYLIAVAVALVRANRNLAELVPRFEAIRDNAAPLSEDLATVNNAMVGLRERLASVDENMNEIARSVRGQ
jgi:hypothetical protein